MSRDQAGRRRTRLASPLVWAGATVLLLGIAFNFGLFFVPINVVFEDPELVPMPEVLIGWWVVGIGVAMVVRALFRRGSR